MLSDENMRKSKKKKYICIRRIKYPQIKNDKNDTGRINKAGNIKKYVARSKWRNKTRNY